MTKARILAVHFPDSPRPELLPELAGILLALSPRVGVRPPDTLYVEVGASARLFGGEEAVLGRLSALLSKKGVLGRAAIADDLASAGALARFGTKQSAIVPPGENERFLAPLPIGSIFFLVNPLSPPVLPEEEAAKEAVTVLSLLGIHTLGGFARIPASTIGPRFGKMGVELHRRARGGSSLPLKPFQPVATYRERHSFEPAAASLEPVLFAAKRLLARLERKLAGDANAASELNLFLETENGEELEIQIPLLRPLDKERSLFPVVREKLDHVALDAPLLSIAVELALPVRQRGSQFHLFDAAVERSERLDELLGRLVAGLGPTMISAAELRERYRPERSWAPVEFRGHLPHSEGETGKVPPRPTILLSSPEPLKARRRNGLLTLEAGKKCFEIASMSGPERLAGEWWDGGPHARDYFLAQTRTGEQLWLFRSLPGPEYYLHGYFD